MYDISIHDQTPHLEVTLNGDVTPQILDSFLEAAAHKSCEHGICRYLLDARRATSRTDILTRHHAVQYRAKDLGIKPGSKLAILATEHDWQEYLTVEMFTANHGYHCKIFLDRNDAVSWLR